MHFHVPITILSYVYPCSKPPGGNLRGLIGYSKPWGRSLGRLAQRTVIWSMGMVPGPKTTTVFPIPYIPMFLLPSSPTCIPASPSLALPHQRRDRKQGEHILRLARVNHPCCIMNEVTIRLSWHGSKAFRAESAGKIVLLQWGADGRYFLVSS